MANYNDEEIRIVTEMYIVCKKPHMYSKDSRVDEIIAFLEESQCCSKDLAVKLPKFKDEVLKDKDLTAMTADELWEAWKEWSGDVSPQPFGQPLYQIKEDQTCQTKNESKS